MRFTLSTLLMGLLAVTHTHALSASSSLARLSARLAAAEQTLAQLQSGYAAPTAQYTWDQVWTDTNGGNPAAKVESWNSNVAFVGNTARGSSVISRTASVSQAATYVRVPVALPAGPFTVGIWISWAGATQPGQSEGVVLSSSGDNVKIAVSSAGVVSATVSGVTISAGSVAVGSWNQFTVSRGANSFSFYKNGVAVSGSPAAVGAFPGSATITLVNNAAHTAGFVGSVDTFHVFSSELDSTDASFLYDDTNKLGSGQSQVIEEGPLRWYGHIDTAGVKFNNVIQAQATGDITLTGKFIDADFRDVNTLWYVLYGCTAPTVNDVAIDYQGTKGTVSWDVNTSILIFDPVLAATIPRGTQWEFKIPGSALNLINPSTTSAKLALPNDPRWLISIFALESDQTPLPAGSPSTKKRIQGLRWQGLTDTPVTFNDKPALLI